MLEIRQNAGDRNAIITFLWDILHREGARDAELSQLVVRIGPSECVLDEVSQSKEDIVSAFLKDRHRIWMHWLESEIEARYEATGGGLEIIADVLHKGFEDPKCLGIAFAHSVTKGAEHGNEPFAIASEQKRHLEEFIEQLAARMALQHPDRVAPAAIFIIEQAIARALMTANAEEAQTARLLFQCLQHA